MEAGPRQGGQGPDQEQGLQAVAGLSRVHLARTRNERGKAYRERGALAAQAFAAPGQSRQLTGPGWRTGSRLPGLLPVPQQYQVAGGDAPEGGAGFPAGLTPHLPQGSLGLPQVQMAKADLGRRPFPLGGIHGRFPHAPEVLQRPREVPAAAESPAGQLVGRGRAVPFQQRPQQVALVLVAGA